MAQPDSSSTTDMATSSTSETPPEEPTQAVETLGARKKRGPGMLTVILVVIIVILAAALAVESLSLLPKPVPTVGSVGVLAETAQVAQGEHLSFTLKNLTVGDVVTANMGDGGAVTLNVTSSVMTFQYAYNTGGEFLVFAQETTTGGTAVSDTSQSLLRISVVPAVPSDVALLETAPTIFFDKTINPTVPVMGVSKTLSFFGTSPVSPYVNTQDFFNTMNSYVDNTTTKTVTNVSDAVVPTTFQWDFGNGNKASANVSYDSNGGVIPDEENVSYSTAGLYTATLTLVNVETETVNVTQLAANGTYTKNTTQSSTVIASYSFSVAQTIAVGNYAIAANFTASSSAGVLTEVVNSPGGPYSFDPQIDYETTGAEVVFNTMGTLLFYQSNSTTVFIPYLADAVPTQANGGISSDNKTYTFHIRSGEYFSNGDPITAYDVWYTFIRSMLFQGGYPGTANWINTQYLITPQTQGGPFAPFTPLLDSSMSPSQLQTVYNDIMNSVTYSSTANTVTFHLWTAQPATLFYTAIVDPLGSGIIDAKWLQSVGGGITFSPQGFLDYEQHANEGSYTSAAQFAPVASGPYMISVYTPGTAVVLKPNPGFPAGVTDIPRQSQTVVLKWALDENVAYQLYVSGQADIVTLLPPKYFPQVATAMGNTGVIHGPTAALISNFAIYNVNVSQPGLAALGSGYNIPSLYFANPLVRKAFAYAFDYTNYLANVLGNAKYGYNFGSGYCGVIIQGLAYHVPENQLTGCPAYDLVQAKALLQQSGFASTVVNFPIIVPTGDPTDYLAGTIWGDAIHSIDSNITAAPAYLPFSSIISNSVPGSNGMPLYFLAWIADYPYPSDFVDAMYLVNGTYPGPDGWNTTVLGNLAASNPTLYGAQYTAWTNLINQIHKADADTDPALAAPDYKAAEQTAVNLYMYVYTYQPTTFWMVRSYMHPYKNDWGYETAPTMGGAQDSIFFYWIKG